MRRHCRFMRDLDRKRAIVHGSQYRISQEHVDQSFYALPAALKILRDNANLLRAILKTPAARP